jgi:hypothetical protein
MQPTQHNGVILIIEKGAVMFIVIGVICLLLLLALSGADMLVSNISSDELSNMGVERKS